MEGQPENPQTYRLSYSGVVVAQIAAILEAAQVRGILGIVGDALRRMEEILATEPLGFGEAQFRLPGMRVLERVGVIHPICINYAVSEDRPIVFIKRITVLSD